MNMEISKMDLSRISLIKGLCESANDFLQRALWKEETPTLNDSPKETLTEILRVIGIVSAWLSPSFKNATHTRVMWGCLASLRHNYNSEIDNSRLSEHDFEITRNDIRVLNELCGLWMKSRETGTPPLMTKGVW